ncbi:hypothetical protein AVEN_82060-1 [Araneus ventricosus]|uniref:Uncharacterized protein n=1 Tax=Araneus ventricosus TaxID=182803 RepID=A0A4Y2SDW1_ARAVE|nr:hypothetical protein AVEN_82060-1 [Araneus ventricosus]
MSVQAQVSSLTSERGSKRSVPSKVAPVLLLNGTLTLCVRDTNQMHDQIKRQTITLLALDNAYFIEEQYFADSYYPDSNFSLQQACHKFVMTRVQVCHKFVMTSVQACSKLAAS